MTIRITTYLILFGLSFTRPFSTSASGKETSYFPQHFCIDSFVIKFDSIPFLIKSSSNQLYTEHLIDKRKTLLKVNYSLLNNTLVSVRATIEDSASNIILDTIV